MHRFFVPKERILDNSISFNEAQLHQIKNVLRLKSGEILEIFDNNLGVYVARIYYESKGLKAEIMSRHSAQTQKFEINVFQSIIKMGKMELVVDKLTEIGINSFTPIITARTQGKDIKAFTQKKLDRLQKICTESAEQSGKVLVPKIRSIMKFKDLLNAHPSQCVCLFYEKNEGTVNLQDINFKENSEVSVIIGPVGGFSEEEISLAKDRGVRSVHLGSSIFKADTASIISVSLIRYFVKEIFNSN